MGSLQGLGSIPLTVSPGQKPQVLAGLASVSRDEQMALVSRYDIQPVIDVYGAVQGRDLGAVASEIEPIVASVQKDLPRGSRIVLRGQVETMRASFGGLLFGLALAIVLVYLLIVVNFQSWLDPFIIITAFRPA